MPSLTARQQQDGLAPLVLPQRGYLLARVPGEPLPPLAERLTTLALLRQERRRVAHRGLTRAEVQAERN